MLMLFVSNEPLRKYSKALVVAQIVRKYGSKQISSAAIDSRTLERRCMQAYHFENCRVGIFLVQNACKLPVRNTYLYFPTECLTHLQSRQRSSSPVTDVVMALPIKKYAPILFAGMDS